MQEKSEQFLVLVILLACGLVVYFNIFPFALLAPGDTIVVDDRSKAIFAELLKKADYTQPITLEIFSFDEEQERMLAYAEYQQGHAVIRISRYVLLAFDEHGKRGVLAHEIAHVVLGHIHYPREERSVNLNMLFDVEANVKAIQLIGKEEFRLFLVEAGLSDAAADRYIYDLEHAACHLPETGQ